MTIVVRFAMTLGCDIFYIVRLDTIHKKYSSDSISCPVRLAKALWHCCSIVTNLTVYISLVNILLQCPVRLSSDRRKDPGYIV